MTLYVKHYPQGDLPAAEYWVWSLEGDAGTILKCPASYPSEAAARAAVAKARGAMGGARYAQVVVA